MRILICSVASLLFLAAPSEPALAAEKAAAEAFPSMRPLWDSAFSTGKSLDDARAEAMFRQAERNGRLWAEALYRCRRFVDGWLAQADPRSGLIPRNLGENRDLWNPRDSAADNYPFMVLTAALTDRALFEGRMFDMLRAEQRLTSRVDRLPDDYLFSRQAFAREKLDLDAVMFGSAEYVKDGLLPLSEWLGRSPWSERMVGIMEDIWKHAPIETPFGRIPTRNVEVNGDLLQACARLYWFTGDSRYLDWGIRLGDYFLLGDQHPTRHFKSLRLSDHGCEVINGLSEMYLAVAFARPEKREAWRQPMHEMLDRILAVGRNADGMLYTDFNPATGAHSASLCDTWGYDYDAFYTVWLIDGTAAYRDAVRHALANLKGKYVGAAWGDTSADGFADSIEGAINLINREPVDSAAEWIDSQTRLMWAKQQPTGIIEGWHGDGNIARTSIMYALWKSQGLTLSPWREDMRLGAAPDGKALCISVAAGEPWNGRILFDTPRHRLHMRLPLDYPRINQFPEWFTVLAGERYILEDLAGGEKRTVSGRQLAQGVDVQLKGGQEIRLRVTPITTVESAALRFVKDGEQYRFDTGLLRGVLRSEGKSMGLLPVHAGETPIARSLGLFSHYRLLDAGTRYGEAGWDWASAARLLPNGAVEVRWQSDAVHPFDMMAVYRWLAPGTLDLQTTVTARKDLRQLEVFLASYFEGFPEAMVYADGADGGAAALRPAEESAGIWQAFPRDDQAVKIITDGRWQRPPHPVDWVVMPRLAGALALRRDATTGLVGLVMAPPEDCFAVLTPYGEEEHRSLYLSLLGRDLNAGQTGTARARLIVGRGLSNERAIELYREYVEEMRR